MSSGIDKEWMKDKNFESDTYKNGVLNFLTFVHENVSGNKHSCPCKRCRNGTCQINVEDIFFGGANIYFLGYLLAYTK
ncbi:hypothetical protein LguiB_008284 [Lonicera macranthoides]